MHLENPQKIVKGTERFVSKRTKRDHLDNIIIKICQDTEKSPGDLRRFAVTQTPVENQQLTLV